MRMDQVRWGMIGCGAVTEKKSAPALSKVAGSRLVAVMRRDGTLAADYARRHGIARWYDDADALIADPEVNAIYIATPPDSHEDYTARAAAAGKPVYVEKPMARTHEECRRMIAACREAGVALFVAYYRRRLPTFLKARELLAEGAIGEPRFVNVRLSRPPEGSDFQRENPPWRVQPEIAGGGHFFDLASHQLDLLDFLLGPIAAAGGRAANQAGLYAAEDIVVASWEHESGVLGAGQWCFTTAEVDRVDRIEIIGGAGRIELATFAPKPVRLLRETGEERFEAEWPEHIQQPLIETVVGELLGGEHCPSSGESAARTAWVMDQIVRGWETRTGIPY